MKLTESKLRNIIREEISFLQEGTWSTPNTVRKAHELKKAMAAPIGPQEFKDNYSNLLGDDKLYNMLNDYRPGEDARAAIANHIRFDILQNLERYTTDFEPQAIEILKQIVEEHTVHSY